MIKSFERINPAVLLAFFVLTVLFTFLTMNPVVLGISLLCAALFAASVSGVKRTILSVLFFLPFALLLALSNPIFNHEGKTVLLFVFDTPVTLESIIYGLCAGLMLLAGVIWFFAFNAVFTSERVLYLFGRVLPKTALLINLTVRFVPKLKRQAGMISDAQRVMGLQSGGFKSRVKSALRVMNVLLGWAIENSVETADSMRARGYGCGKRTSYSAYRFRFFDGAALAGVLLLGGFCVAAFVMNIFDVSFFPAITGFDFSVFGIAMYSVLAVFLLAPFCGEVLWRCKWLRLK